MFKGNEILMVQEINNQLFESDEIALSMLTLIKVLSKSSSSLHPSKERIFTNVLNREFDA